MSNRYMEAKLYTRTGHSNIGENGDARLVIMKMPAVEKDYIM